MALTRHLTARGAGVEPANGPAAGSGSGPAGDGPPTAGAGPRPAVAGAAVGAGATSGALPEGRRRRLFGLVIPVVTTLAVLGVWEVLARSGALPNSFPPFSTVISWIYDQRGDSTFWTALAQTVWHWFAGLAIGAVAGTILGIAIGGVPLIQRLLNLPLELLRPIPAVVYLPLLILIWGSRSQTAILLAAVGAFWPMLFQTIYGVRAIDPQSIETGRVFGLTATQRLWKIMFPSLLPYLATGVRIASSLSLVVAVSIELVGGVAGLGAQLASYSQNAIYPAMYGILLVSGVLGLLLNLILERTERRLLHWHVSHRGIGR
jgi:ABC-type nitrate/sulfonate/bicarbonate transport system permease component